jgi:hypothetical protein
MSDIEIAIAEEDPLSESSARGLTDPEPCLLIDSR